MWAVDELQQVNGMLHVWGAQCTGAFPLGVTCCPLLRTVGDRGDCWHARLQFDGDFEARAAGAAADNRVLRYVAAIDVAAGTCSVGLQVRGNAALR